MGLALIDFYLSPLFVSVRDVIIVSVPLKLHFYSFKRRKIIYVRYGPLTVITSELLREFKPGSDVIIFFNFL